MKHVRRLPELTTKGKIGVGLVVFVVIAVIGTYVVTSIITNQLSSTGDVDKQDFTKKDSKTRVSDALKTARSAVNDGDDKKAANIYDKAIAAEPDPNKKVKLAIDHSRLLYHSKKYDEALAVAKKAESYNSDKFLIANWLGGLYEVGKQYNEAASYYALAGSLVKSPTNDTGYIKKFYDGKVATMKLLAEKK